jgi:hypothetical protein
LRRLHWISVTGSANEKFADQPLLLRMNETIGGNGASVWIEAAPPESCATAMPGPDSDTAKAARQMRTNDIAAPNRDGPRLWSRPSASRFIAGLFLTQIGLLPDAHTHELSKR